MEILCLQDVSFSYVNQKDLDVSKALDSVNLTIKEGEYLSVIGHNGSGKSTFARLLNGLLIPSKGRVLAQGIDTAEEKTIWQVRQSVGMVFQNPDNQIVATTVEEDIAFGPENLGLPSLKIKQRVAEALELVKMAEYRNHPPHLLSGGQKQRLAIAGILAMKPKCLVMDEPTSMLDPIGREEVLATVERLNRDEGLTIINITHFMEEAARTNRTLVFENGKIARDTCPAKLFEKSDFLEKIGLDVPIYFKLAERLRGAGFKLSSSIKSVDDLVMELCSLK